MLLQMSFFHSLYSCVIFHCLCVCVCVYHIFLTHSSVDGHVGCLHILALVNCSGMNIELYVSFQIKLCPDTCPGLLDHVIVLCLIFKGNSILFP